MSNFQTYPIPAEKQFYQQGTAVLAGFIATDEQNKDILVSVSGWQPDGGSHATIVMTKTLEQGGHYGIWFRVNFVGDRANGIVWLTFYQGGNPNWGTPEGTKIEFMDYPWH